MSARQPTHYGSMERGQSAASAPSRALSSGVPPPAASSFEASLSSKFEALDRTIVCLEEVQNMHAQERRHAVLQNLKKKMAQLHTAVKTLVLDITSDIAKIQTNSDPNKRGQTDQFKRLLSQAEEKYHSNNTRHRKSILQQLSAADEDREEDFDAEDIPLRRTFNADVSADVSAASINDRDRGIRKLEQDMIAINEMFRDLGVMVQQQGHMLDNIESNMTATEIYTGRAVEELQEAKQHQNASRKKLFCICFWLLLVLAVIILVAVMTTKH